MGVDELIISTFNVNGLGNIQKKRDVFNFLREKKHDIYLLQETHIKESEEKYVRALWGYELWVSGNSTNQNGVAILFNSTFEYKILNVTKDPNGCFIIMDVELRGKRTTLTNIYGPSAGDNPDFISRVFNLANQLGNDTVILGGDWNCLLDMNLDSQNYTNINNPRPRTRTKILDSMSDLDLIDIFRKLYPDKKAYSWKKFNSNKRGRLDYFLISQNLLGEIKKSSITPGYRSDHSLVSMSIRTKEFKRDRTFWKFNNSLLKDKVYVRMIKELIEKVKQQYSIMIYSPEAINNIPPDEVQFTITDQLFFEVLLMEIRGKSISYAAYRKKVQTEREKELNKRLLDIEEKTLLTNEDILIFETTKNELEQFRKNRMEGVAVRCKANWINEGEKPTRYFCNLENRNFIDKSVSFLEMPSGEIIDDQKGILREVEMFYSSLYSQKEVRDVDISTIIDEAPKLNETDIDLLESEITIQEIASALKNMNNNKSPGPDGFTVEFFKFFFTDIGQYYTRSIIEGLAQSRLSVTQYQGIITCIPKDDKPKQFIKNWRPISLLNVSYKIVSSCIATRIQKVLPKIIHHSQKGFIKGRYIGDNIRTLFDILEYTSREGLPGLIVAIDFEKAFDSVAWSFIEKSLTFFGFPVNIVNWFKTLYSSPSSCITFNGQYSNWFKLGRGCRQGDPISPYLYLLCAEIMSLMFRKHADIKGIKIKDETTLLSLFADDTALFLDGSESSFKNAFEVLDNFSAMSGLKINNEKTQIVWIGSSIGCGTRFMRDRNFVWDPGTFKILGITFSVNINQIVNLNFKDKIDDIKRNIAKWSRRNLTPIGKITLIKTLMVSKITYLLINLPDPPSKFLADLDNILTRFLWGGKVNRIKKSTTYKAYHEGGLKMYNIYSSLSTFKISWLKRLENYNDKELPSLRMYPFLKNLNKYGTAYPDYIKRSTKNPFWLDVLKHLEKLYSIPQKINAENIDLLLNEPLHYNHNLKTGNRPVFSTEWTERNITTIRDLMTDDGTTLIDYNTFKTKYMDTPKTNFLNFNGIRQAVKIFLREMKSKVEFTLKCSYWVWDVIRAGNYQVKKSLETDTRPPTATLKWNTYFPNLVWKTIFFKCFKTTSDTQLQWFQARILHRILPTRRHLAICNIVNSPTCLQCNNHEETLCHLFWECSFANQFWKDLEELLRSNCYNCARLSFKLELVIFGTSENFRTDKAIDFIIIFAKFYIYKCRFQEVTPNCTSFMLSLKDRVNTERMIALRMNRYDQFRLTWLPYSNLIDHL